LHELNCSNVTVFWSERRFIYFIAGRWTEDERKRGTRSLLQILDMPCSIIMCERICFRGKATLSRPYNHSSKKLFRLKIHPTTDFKDTKISYLRKRSMIYNLYH